MKIIDNKNSGMQELPENKKKTIDLCDDVQMVLFDYMSRELGDNRAELVGEHLRKCEKCQAAAAEIQKTLELLGKAGEADKWVEYRLSEKRRQRIHWAILHPVLDWIYRNHIICALTVAIAIVLAVLILLIKMQIWRPLPKPTLPVNIKPLNGNVTNEVVIPEE